ncbi:MAG: homoserine kinase [Sphingomonas sp.]|nr:homoserine kinase [Sphingomonas sp.]
MAVYTHVSAEALADFLMRFDVGELVSAKGIAEGVENSNYLVDTTGGRFFLTLYEKRVDVGDLPYFMALLDHLDAKGLPVPPAIKDRTGIEILELAGRPTCLIKYLSGVSPSHPTPQQAQAVGVALGRMHRAVADFEPIRANSMGVESWRPLFERCGADLDQIRPGLYDETARLVDQVLKNWPVQGALPRCAIHADLFPDNVLMRGDKVTGLIDFYFACTDFRAYDLAVTHTAWAFDATGTHRNDSVGQALVEGYRATVSLTESELVALPALARGACLRFFLSRAWDWLNTPADALVTRKDPLAYLRRYEHYMTGNVFA